MKRIFFVSLLIGLGLFSGCAQKDVVVDTKQTPKKQEVEVVKKVDNKIEQIATDTVEPIQEEVVEQDNQTNSKDNYINETVSIIDGEKVVLKSIHFKFDDYHLTDDMVTIANDNANKIDSIKSKNNSVKVKLEGNCDEWGTDEYNYALGLKRAKTVKKSLIQNGINKNDIVIVSYGESNPICKEHSLTCWKRNRRVDYKLLP